MSDERTKGLWRWWDESVAAFPPWRIDDKSILAEIYRRLQMDKKVSREIWDKWTGRIKDDYNLGPMHIIYLMKEMLTELGLEVEEKEVGDE